MIYIHEFYSPFTLRKSLRMQERNSSIIMLASNILCVGMKVLLEEPNISYATHALW